jgi:hypothetical protein
MGRFNQMAGKLPKKAFSSILLVLRDKSGAGAHAEHLACSGDTVCAAGGS